MDEKELWKGDVLPTWKEYDNYELGIIRLDIKLRGVLTQDRIEEK